MVWKIFPEKKKRIQREMENAFNLSVCLCKSKELNCGLHWMHFHSKMVVDLKGYRRLPVAESRQWGRWELAVSQASLSYSVTEILPIQLPGLSTVGEREVLPGFTYLSLLVRQILDGSYTPTTGHMTRLSQ